MHGIASIPSHLLAAYAVIAAPWLGYVWFRKLKNRIAAGEHDARLRIYRDLVLEQVVSTIAVLAVWRLGQLPAASLGLVLPRRWMWNVAAIAAFAALIVWSSIGLRRRAAEIREKLKNGVGMLFPRSEQEWRWFGAVSVGAGISEEMVFRGFLFYYLGTYLPQLNGFEKALLVSFVFGFAHLYQGWKGMIGTGAVGFILAGLYLLTGSLLLPIAVHAIGDARVLLIFPPESTENVRLAESA